ncbi:MAG: restriction endonuclease subunit S [Bacteroidales bacterium]|jgi:type I restriction enzyme S subunit|nr:restriction endonuclease subunit S [Bacteroidales bacterium]
MKAEELRKSILQLAIQGKLVKQNPDDEPASVLLEKIRVEKQRLVKEGKIKKEKTESFIYRGADNSYYEKIGNNYELRIKNYEERCIDDEIPFEVPDSWEWVRLNNVCHIIMGQSPDGTSVTNSSDGIEFHQGKVFFTNRIIGKSAQTTIAPSKIAPEESVLLCVRAPVGKVNLTDRELCIGRGLCSLKPFISISIDFLYYLLETYEDIFVKQATGTTFIAITGEVVNKQLVPIPPLSEQQRIINQLELLEPLIAEYDKYEKKETLLAADFPDKLKKSILQSAIQGKLVAQNPDDEPASVLLETIRKEKEQLIKSGKLKRDKNESFIYKDAADNSYYEKIGGETRCIDDEVPFEVPDSWEWCRLKNIVQINPTNKADDNVNASFVTMKYIEAGYSNSFTFEEKEWGKIKKGFTHFQNGDVAFAKITPCFQNRKSLIFNNLANNIGAGTTELHILRPISEYINPFYLLICVKTEYFVKYGITNFTGTAGQQRFPTDKLKDILIPLPPAREQKQIAKKVKLLFTLFH